MTRSTIITADATRQEVDRSMARHSLSNGPSAEHAGITVPGCVGCEWRFASLEVASIRREGAHRNAALYRTGNTFVAIDLDGPFIDIVDSLFHAGLDSERAEDEAWRLVNP